MNHTASLSTPGPAVGSDSFWEGVNTVVQEELRLLAAEVRKANPQITCQLSHSSANAWNLFSYATFASGMDGGDIDPVVAGIMFSAGQSGTRVSGDIAGEELGDVLFELPQVEVKDRLALAKAARDTARKFAGQWKLITEALINTARKRPD
jgi:hypothetical protein